MTNFNDVRSAIVCLTDGRMLATEAADLIAAYADERVAAERKRIAQAITAEGEHYRATRQDSAPHVVIELVVAAYTHGADIALGTRGEAEALTGAVDDAERVEDGRHE